MQLLYNCNPLPSYLTQQDVKQKTSRKRGNLLSVSDRFIRGGRAKAIIRARCREATTMACLNEKQKQAKHDITPLINNREMKKEKRV